MTDATIEFARKNEGFIYGDGTAGLLERLKDKLSALPRDGQPTGTTNAWETAKVIHEVLREASEAEGQKPDIDTFIRDERNGSWRISWERGPYSWANQASNVVMNVTGRLCEPDHNFDLCIYEVE